MKKLLFLLVALLATNLSAQDLPYGWTKTDGHVWKKGTTTLYKYKYKDYALSYSQAAAAVKKSPVSGYNFKQYESVKILQLDMHMGMFFNWNNSKMMVRIMISGDYGQENVWVAYLTKFDMQTFEDIGYIVGSKTY